MSSKAPHNAFDPRRRLLLIAIILLACGFAIAARAAWMQLVSPQFYQQQGDARFVRELPIVASRGPILDRHGETLAASSPVASIWANPRVALQHAHRFAELATVLGVPAENLRQRIAERADREFVYLRRHLNPDQAAAVLALGIPGVHEQREFRRFYPHGEVMAHVLGFTNIDDRGQEGLELAFNPWLTGTPGAKRVIRDREGRIIASADLLRAAEPGRELVTSIDRRVQYLAFRELKAALRLHRASSGSVVVLDIPTGEVIAMVNLPSFNPNARAIGPSAARRNRAVTDVLEPGSVIKSFTVAAAMENGADPTHQFDTSPGLFPLHRHTIRDVRNFGMVDMTTLLQRSSNIASTKLALDMSDEHFHDVLRRFGFGSITGSGFPGEVAGVLTDPRGWGDVEKATISFGYGLSATPLQIAQAYAVLANDGRMLPPTFVRGGNAALGAGRQVIDPQIARSVIGMLESVVAPGGTATSAAIAGYRVAGKTGTTRIAVPGGYQKRHISVFAGVVPVQQPRFAMVVTVHEPSAGHFFAGVVAAPVFQNVMDGALRLMDVPPDNVRQWLTGTAKPVAPTSAEIGSDGLVPTGAVSGPDAGLVP
ncbi:penicillin-binding protein 2 [Silanimonas sp.]|uniref:peptidoglycan D,D-transpeptidase FtsI family protein n=1 Tax=Silanimonas sp. TaxID=1929290 RepID=UPI001BC02365|nr:penicillin-binding protein 2 [Silanimonas sp.]MBS3896152.1 penicillin-binding protein 2 [Silanimonas sp.]